MSTVYRFSFKMERYRYMNFNIEEFKDKIYGCWTGKNIGGTIGGPYEGMQEVLDVRGFSTPKGEVLPNDDLDLQLVWLKALEERGVGGISALVLGEYWMNYISPNWNEYGIAKANMAAGFYPPLSGSMDNIWKNSNGAWIRSEIWACISPGNPDRAAEYAMEDACVDHGIAEGTYGEVFVAAVESAAFAVSDFQTLIKIGLARIPSDCKVAKSVLTALEAWQEGVSWQEARQRVLDCSLKELGWFQAPANIGFVVIGMLYGEKDFKKSMLIALNCGDDTDCTCATLGALFGIIYGMRGIPKDWREYIGDTINTVAVNKGEMLFLPADTQELTERVYRVALSNCVSKPVCHFIPAERRNVLGEVRISEEASDIQPSEIKRFLTSEKTAEIWKREQYSFKVDFIHTEAEVSFDEAPVIKTGEYLKIHILMKNKMMEPADPRRLEIHWILPENFQVFGPMDIFVSGLGSNGGGIGSADYQIEAGCITRGINRLYISVIWNGRPTVGLIPIVIRGVS